MRIINLTNAPINDSQFDEVKISRYYRTRLDHCIHLISVSTSNDTLQHTLSSLVRWVKELDTRNAGKVCISGFLGAEKIKAITQAMLLHGYDVYTTQMTSENITWVDPR